MVIENERAHKLELLALVSLQYLSHLCNIKLADVDAPEFICAGNALTEAWQNYLIFLREVYLKAGPTGAENV